MAYPQTQEILAQLKSQYFLAVVSDAQTAYAIPELHRAGLVEFFNPIVISGDYGYRKPDPRLFRTALDKLAVGPEEAIFIGNDPFRDIEGARQVGMKTILFCPNGSPVCPPERTPDYLLYQYADLPRAIQFLNGELA